MPTVKQLHDAIKKYNSNNCIRGYSNKKKAALIQIVDKLKQPHGAGKQKQPHGAGAGAGAGKHHKKVKKRIQPTLVSPHVGGGAGFGKPQSGGGIVANIVGQKNFKKKMKKLKKKTKKLKGKDANPELAF